MGGQREVQMKLLSLTYFCFATLLAQLGAEVTQAPAPFTIVVMPDTQKYVEFYPRGIANQTEWIRKNRDVLNCKFVIHEGDIVQNPAKLEEWVIADAAFKNLDGILPYCFTLGNHDMDVGKRDKTLYRETFPLTRFQSMPTYGGSQNEFADNTFHTFEVGPLKFMVITVEYSPDDVCLNWANDVIAKHPDHRVIVDTHSYLNVNERNDQGKIVWDKCVRKHPNIFLVLCGHESIGRRAARGDHGNLVHEVLANYQGHDNGGNGWLRLLRFHPAENRIAVKTYSTLFNRYMEEGDPRWSRVSDNHFELPYLMNEGEPKEDTLALQSVPETASPKGLYHAMEVEGWPVFLHPDLEHGDPDLSQRTLDLLGKQLATMVEVLPERAIQELREVPIWIERAHPMHECMCYHPDAAWLRENAMNPDKAGAVEIANAQAFLDWSEAQPWMVLHEMAHAYHFRRLGAEHPDVRRAYELAVAGKRYQSVAHVSGEDHRHYALTDELEYFAEATEAYFGKNDFYPFHREELATHDPEILRLMPELWEETPLEARLKEFKKIWNEKPHSAFTDMVAWQGKLVCAFREGEKHADDHGQIRVLISSDGGKEWKPAAILRQDGVDLRDARLSVTPDDRLMLIGGLQTGNSDARTTRSIVSFSHDAFSWTLPEPIGETGRWLWGATWHQGHAYGVAYPAPDGKPHTSLMTSSDGKEFKPIIPEFVSEGRPTEAVIRFDSNGGVNCLHRREDGPGLFGHADDPEGSWHWQTLNRRIGGPGLIQIPSGHWIAVVRLYDQSERTEICLVDTDNARLTPLLRLPSGGDTSYPGLVWQNDELLISYYSSHEDKTSIYFARVSIDL